MAGRLALRRARARVAGASSIDVERLCGALHDFPRDHHVLDAFEARKIEHGVEQNALHDGTLAAGPGLAVDRLPGDRAERFVRLIWSGWSPRRSGFATWPLRKIPL
jgi:hypothetical protein